MMMVRKFDDEALNQLLDELDLKAKKVHPGENSDSYWVCRRQSPRHPFRADCKIRFLPVGSLAVMELPGRTRNLSRRGIGVLVRRVFTGGEPVEIEVNVPDRPLMFFAGLVTFCRYAGRGYQEVGVDLRAAGSEPIFSHNPVQALKSLEWMREGQTE